MSEIRPKPIKLMPDYGHPLWWDTEQPLSRHWPDQIGNIDPADLGLSAALVADLAAWAERFDAMLDWNDPGNTPAPEPAIAAQYEADGRDLAQRLARELGSNAVIRYWRDSAGDGHATS